MRPDFGSELYKLRDRDFNTETKAMIAKYTYEAISKYEPRVRVSKVESSIHAVTGSMKIIITLMNSKKIEVSL